MKQQYKTYEQTCNFLEKCVKSHPDLIRIESIGRTHENREIMLATISLHVEYADLKPALLYTGTIHAREWIGNELAIAFIDYVLSNYDKNPNVLEAITKNTLYIVPCLNPDGFEYSRNHFSFWRKNRRDNKDGTFGVDLNRNFSVGFIHNKNTGSNVYGGPSPFSEPETKAIKEFVDNHDNITLALDYHSQGNVFFPAHKFRHEQEIEGTDLNTLAANMNYHIYKVTKRKYGIHRGKPPTKLISGSGREYYYSKGIISMVVEVGTRNISDYMKNMRESINENIPALLHTLCEASNYSKIAPKRVENFVIDSFGANEVLLSWEHEKSRDIYFEIYRNEANKEACNEHSLIGITKEFGFRDVELQSGSDYYYYIRAVDGITGIKSPFAPQVKVRTLLELNEFSRAIFPNPLEVGYVASKMIETNRKHFGKNSLFVGVNELKGVSYGVIKFDLSSIPEDAIIKEVKFSLYAMNRVNVKIEKYGEWLTSILDQEFINDITDFNQIDEAKVIHTLGDTIPSEQLAQGMWSCWGFNEKEREILEKELSKKSVLFRVSGPIKLPTGRDSQMMMFDIGYGPFGGGIHYRPSLHVKYTLPSTKITLKPNKIATIWKDKIEEGELKCGFDSQNSKIYGLMSFDMSVLPDPKDTVITESYIGIKNRTTPKIPLDIRYTLEYVETDEDIDFESIKQRDRIGFIGYEVSRADLQKKKRHYFMFDDFSMQNLQQMHKLYKNAKFLIKPTSAVSKDHIIKWEEDSVELVIKYIKRRKEPVGCVENLSYGIENKKIKLTWENPDDKDFVGAYVVRNRFHPPKNQFDGDKIYAGKDNYTYDDFGSLDIHKYYAVFTYDNVPNYSSAVTIEYIP